MRLADQLIWGRINSWGKQRYLPLPTTPPRTDRFPDSTQYIPPFQTGGVLSVYGEFVTAEVGLTQSIFPYFFDVQSKILMCRRS